MELRISPGQAHDLVALTASSQTPAVGSSHGDFGFNPAFVPDSFTLCSPSRDLRHS